jgi:uncharacterized protein YdhG (YjbR/CyaY superfamily)
MATKKVSAANEVDRYIAQFPEETRAQLETIRTLIRKAAPEAEEVISYGMPTYKLKKNLVHFAGYKEHIGFYPTPQPIVEFHKELAKYKTSKGAVQFPIEEKIPSALVNKIVKYRVKQETAGKKAAVKKTVSTKTATKKAKKK